MVEVRETELDLGALLSALRRKAWLLVLIGIAVAAATYLGLSYVAPIYKAGARVLIEVRESFLTRPRDTTETAVALQVDESAIQSYVEILRSRDIAETVIDRLGLDRRPEFDPEARPSVLANLLFLAGLRQSPADTSIRERAVETYYDRLDIYPVGRSRVIAVDFASPDPQLSAEVANAVTDAFLDVQNQAKRDATGAATRWLEEEITRLRQRVAEAEAAVEAFRSGSELFPSANDGSLTSQQLTDLNAELARAKAARSEAEARAELIRQLLQEGGSLETSAEVLSAPLIQRLRERQVALASEIAELSATHLPGHPRIEALTMQRTDLEEQIRREAEKILQSLETAARVAAARQNALTESLNEAKAAAAQANEESIGLRALEREARAERELLEAFLARYREAVARTDSDYLPADARIISRAVAPLNPSFPKKTMLSIVAAIAALMLTVALILTREFTSGRAFRIVSAGAGPAHDAPDLARERRQPELDLDEIGTPAPAPPIAVPEDAPGTVELARALADPAVRLALFVGAEGGEGAGEVALAAARLAAEDGARPVLLDIGVKPSPVLGGDATPGLGELLSGNAAFGEVIRRMEGSRIHFIAMGSAEEDPPLQRLSLVIGALAHTYDKVVVVADALGDWPAEHVRPDLAAIVCGSDLELAERQAAYEWALERGARSAVVIRRLGETTSADEPELEEEEREAAGAVA
jgi:polysaccharide biosynthesis transport protein